MNEYYEYDDLYDDLYYEQEDSCARAYVDGRNAARDGGKKSPPNELRDSERMCWIEGYEDVINEETI